MKCEGIIGRIFGHKFVPRYDGDNSFSNVVRAIYEKSVHSSMNSERVENMLRQSNNSIVKIARSNARGKYIKDICLRCGQELVSVPVSPERRIDPEL